jgi:hypothetical protein
LRGVIRHALSGKLGRRFPVDPSLQSERLMMKAAVNHPAEQPHRRIENHDAPADL